MPAIHIIKNDQSLPAIKPLKPGSDHFSSGNWAVANSTAKALIGGTIHFHEKQTKPSFFGGIITGVEPSSGGDRIVFIFRRDHAAKGVTTPRSGWAQEMKIIL